MNSKEITRLAVIGGGAKAAAIAAKAYALKQQGIGTVEVTIFEKSEIGAAWSGKHGYTDGNQRLCTPGERDVGFPYSSMYGSKIDHRIYADFSWSNFLLTTPQRYGSWVDQGRPAPLHAEFAKYLSWVVRQAKSEVVAAEVVGLAESEKKWLVSYRAKDGVVRESKLPGFDGVIVSSPGPARQIEFNGVSSLIFNGQDFWLRLNEFKKIVKAEGKFAEIAIVGAGGTAAAILAWLTQNGYKDYDIKLVSEQAALFTRGDSVFENRLFNDETAWQELSLASKKAFFDRLNRGVVWGTVMEQVSTARQLVLQYGRARRVTLSADGKLEVHVVKGNGISSQIRPTVLIDASGFDTWWFLTLLKGVPRSAAKLEAFKKSLQDGMDGGLKFGAQPWNKPPLHAPFLSSAVGPGFGSLMSLGGMSDRILRDYVQ